MTRLPSPESARGRACSVSRMLVLPSSRKVASPSSQAEQGSAPRRRRQERERRTAVVRVAGRVGAAEGAAGRASDAADRVAALGGTDAVVCEGRGEVSSGSTTILLIDEMPEGEEGAEEGRRRRTGSRAGDEVGAGAAAASVVGRVDAGVGAGEVARGRVAGEAEVAADLARAVGAERVAVRRDVARLAAALLVGGEGRDALVALLREATVAGVRAVAAVADVGRVGRAEGSAVLADLVCAARARECVSVRAHPRDDVGHVELVVTSSERTRRTHWCRSGCDERRRRAWCPS